MNVAHQRAEYLSVDKMADSHPTGRASGITQALLVNWFELITWFLCIC